MSDSTVFGIDSGELDEFSQPKCFVLGFEFGQFMEKLKYAEPFTMRMHAPNNSRVRAALEQFERTGTIRLCHDDWIDVEVSHE